MATASSTGTKWGRDREEVLEEWDKEREKRSKPSWTANITPLQKVFIGVVLLFIIYLYLISKPECPSHTVLDEDSNRCYYCKEGELDSRYLICLTSKNDTTGSCPKTFTWENESSICTGNAVYKSPTKNFDIKTLAIILAALAALYFFFNKESITSVDIEKTDEQLLSILDAHIKRKQRTLIGGGFQIDPDAQITISSECDIPSITTPFQQVIRDLKFFVVREVNPTTKDEILYHVALDIYTGDLKKWKTIGEETLLQDIKNIVYVPTEELREKMHRATMERRTGMSGGKSK